MSGQSSHFSGDRGSVSVWLQKLPAGDEQAQNEILNRFRDKLVGYAAYRLRQMGVRAKDAEIRE